MVKNLPVVEKMWVQSLGGGDTLQEEMAIHSNFLTSVICPHGQRSLAGCSPWG